MTLQDFIAKHRQANTPVKNLLEDGVEALNRRINPEGRRPPVHIPDQRSLLEDHFDTDADAWVIVLDAGRYDLFDQIVDDYFNGSLRRCWNGDIGYTGDWFVRNLSGRYEDRGLFSWVPLRGQEIDYDGRQHFDVAPTIGGGLNVNERLAALGYRDGEIDDGHTEAPAEVNREVRQHLNSLSGGVVRYIKPHPPFEGMEAMTSEATKTMKTQAALDDGRLSDAELVDAYIETYRTGLEYARELVDDLEGRVVLTADHGTCLTCGQLFHGRHHEKHDHLTVVPWFEVEVEDS